MRIFPNSMTFPKRLAKSLKKASEHHSVPMKLSYAQMMIARAMGCRNWHELEAGVAVSKEVAHIQDFNARIRAGLSSALQDDRWAAVADALVDETIPKLHTQSAA